MFKFGDRVMFRKQAMDDYCWGLATVKAVYLNEVCLKPDDADYPKSVYRKNDDVILLEHAHEDVHYTEMSVWWPEHWVYLDGEWRNSGQLTA